MQPLADEFRQRLGMSGNTGHMLARYYGRFAVRRQAAARVGGKCNIIFVRSCDDTEEWSINSGRQIASHDPVTPM